MIEWIIAIYVATFAAYGTIKAVKDIAKNAKEKRERKALIYYVFERHVDPEFLVGVFDNYEEASELMDELERKKDKHPSVSYGIRWRRCEFLKKEDE